jgi:hypothetical protein
VRGIIFNLLEEVVATEHGEDTWDDLLDAAGVSGVYTSLGSYDDADLLALVDAAATALSLPTDEVLRRCGRAMIPLLAARYPAFFEDHTTSRDFIVSLNEVHAEVTRLFPGAAPPQFTFDTSSATTLVADYQSERGMCPLGEGLIQGAADHYGETIAIDRPECRNHGGERCLIAVTPV